MDNRFIGVFDSGLGGLTAVKEFMKILPNEKIIYFGDTARVPYGTRSPETIKRYVNDDIEFLCSRNVKLIVSACGTASSVALPYLTKTPVPVIGVIEHASAEAVKRTKNNKIGVIATEGSIKSGKYEEEIKKLSDKAEVYSVACPMFVPLVENGYAKSEVAKIIAKEYLEPLKNAGVDTLVLGCTHYPLLRGVISDIMSENTYLVDPGAQTAKYVKSVLESQDMLSGEKTGGHEFWVSDSPEGFKKLCSTFLESDMEIEVRKVDIQ